ncbi:sensor histidine kinase [Dyadobacter crusticola]|uniref:sensor histidine kinase n=1 Tax=Dyadobacter crusticola TaxID=292407 RepID=UPI0004E1DF04|nr:HAMP domain-containing sensor histidine kinase [Dyadobacter crusticola]
MAPAAPYSAQSLGELVNYLFTRREAILNNWRTACEKGPALGKVSLLSREEFNNLLPIILDILEQRLLGKPPEADLALTAQGHGLHRWHKALELMETMRELKYFSHILYAELELFVQLFPNADKSLLLYVYAQIAALMQETIDGSVQKYDELQRLQASSRAAALQSAIEQMQELSLQRDDMLRTSSHDLRGSFGIINSAAMLLKMEGVSPQEKEEFMEMMSRNLANVHAMLTGLMDLSRLEAGQETLKIESVDAAKLLNDIVAGAQPMAAEKNIVLRGDGPAMLVVETDQVKLQRVIQNILINAIKYTPSSPQHPSIVSVSWSTEGDYRWIFSIQDSGPGLPDNLTGVFREQLRPTVEPASVMGLDQAEPVVVLPEGIPQIPSADQLAQITNHATKSEGVGLQIVKRLCEMLDANLDIESVKSRGTLFRVRLPIHHTA